MILTYIRNQPYIMVLAVIGPGQLGIDHGDFHLVHAQLSRTLLSANIGTTMDAYLYLVHENVLGRLVDNPDIQVVTHAHPYSTDLKNAVTTWWERSTGNLQFL